MMKIKKIIEAYIMPLKFEQPEFKVEFYTIEDAQNAFCRKQINHKEFWQLQQLIIKNRLQPLKFNSEDETTS